MHPDEIALIRLALGEDIGTGDLTTNACIPADRLATGKYFARENVVVAGLELLPVIYTEFGDEDVRISAHVRDGERVDSGACVATVYGRARTLLTCERVSLNLLQRLSGIATLATQYVEAVHGTGVKVLDTRKTTPGMRRLEKRAAAAGGVQNHRMGLYDAVLIKNNHITAAGGIRQALAQTFPEGVPVEIEVRTRAEIDEALDAGAKHLLLDNQTPEQAADQIRYIAGRATVELSGNIRLDTIRAYAEALPDYISCGAITHSSRAVDFNFRVELE